MQKGILLVPRNAAREILSPDDALRMLASKSWVETKEPVSAVAIRQRKYRARSKRDGYKMFAAWVPVEVWDALIACRRPGETNADLITRLVMLFRFIGDTSQMDRDN